jgi:hypothetical protein
MSLRHVSMASLLWAVAVLALGCAALTRASQLWASVVFTTAATVLTLAVLRALYSDGTRRAFHVGFALCGWLYLWYTVVLKLGDAPPLLTIFAINVSLPYVLPAAFTRDQNGQIIGALGDMVIHYRQIGHSLCALLLGLAGGFLAVHLRKRHRSTA